MIAVRNRGVKTELAVEPDMLGAVGKGEQSGMADIPSIQLITGRGDKALPDAAVPEIGPGRQWSEEADAAPARREIRSDERALIVFSAAKAAVCSAPNRP